MFPVAVQGDTIELRELEAEDGASIAARLADEAVLRYTTWEGPADREAAERFVRLARETAAASPRKEYRLAIGMQHSGEVVGTGGIRHEDEVGEVGSLRILLRFRDARAAQD
jgi:RimJ/RimL family protein N-acetyltransferase